MDAHQVASFYVASCPRCSGLSIVENLGAVKRASCKRCGIKAPPTEWKATEPFMTAIEAREALLAATDPDNPEPLSFVAVTVSFKRPNASVRLASLLKELEREPITWNALAKAFAEAGVDSALDGLVRKGEVYKLAGSNGKLWVVSHGAWNRL